MAKLKLGIFGPISGKLGNLIGGVWKGIPYVKEYKPKEEKGKRSAARLANEEKFRFVNNWLVPFHPFISVGYLNMATRQTTVSAAFSQIYNTVFSGTFPNLEIDHSKMAISMGKLPMVLDTAVNFLAEDIIQLSWNKNTRKGTKYNDQIIVVLYDREQEIADGFIGGVNRSAESCSYKFNEYLIGKQLDIYVGISSMDRTKISDSQYLGRFNP
ncbi:MAG: DUF6266 family protein [Bacteroidota bacterium]